MVQVFRAAVQVRIQVLYFLLLFGRPPGRPPVLTTTGLPPGLMFVGLQGSEVMAKPGLFLSPTGVQQMQRKIADGQCWLGCERCKKDAKQTCLGFPLRDLLYGAIKVHFSSQE